MPERTTPTTDLTTLWTEIAMGESARWHDGRFWCSDWVAGEILTQAPDGSKQVVARLTSFPFCFDWTAGGEMLVTSATGLERLVDGTLVPHADLSALSPYGWNEPLVAPNGNVYVNDINFDMSSGFDFELGSRTGLIALVTPSGEARLVAEGLAFPNGMALTPDGSTLIVAESFKYRLAAFDVQPDGSLSNHRVWAEQAADGVSLDREGGLWCATQEGAVRVIEGGEVTDRVDTPKAGFSCALGGRDGRTLFIVCNEWNGPENIGKGPRTGEVLTARVQVPALS